MKTLKDRLLLITKYLGISGREFERACGLTTGAFAGFGDRLGADILKKIAIKYPQFSTRWILTGEGEMLTSTSPNSGIDANILEKFYALFESRENEHKTILGQNSEIIRQNSDIIKQNSEVMRQNGELIKIVAKFIEK